MCDLIWSDLIWSDLIGFELCDHLRACRSAHARLQREPLHRGGAGRELYVVPRVVRAREWLIVRVRVPQRCWEAWTWLKSTPMSEVSATLR